MKGTPSVPGTRAESSAYGAMRELVGGQLVPPLEVPCPEVRVQRAEILTQLCGSALGKVARLLHVRGRTCLSGGIELDHGEVHVWAVGHLRRRCPGAPPAEVHHAAEVSLPQATQEKLGEATVRRLALRTSSGIVRSALLQRDP